MELNNYQEQAATTAQYPKEIGLVYTTLGLSGEAGELANKVKKILRGDYTVDNPDLHDALKQELGDCLWYVAMIASELHVLLDQVAQLNLDKLQDRTERDMVKGSGDNR